MCFPAFHRCHGAAATYRALSDEAEARLAARLPADLIALFRADGFASYGGGLLFTLDDRDVEAARLAWLPSFPQISVFARTAFGTLYIWDGGTVQVLLPHVAMVGFLAGSAERLFEETFTVPSYIEKSLKPGLRAAKSAAGPLQWDEMYGHDPPIAQSTDGPRTTIRVGLVEHHVMLSKLKPLRALFGL